MSRTILIPIDRTEESQKILPEVKRFIPAEGTTLILFYVAAIPKLVGQPVPAHTPQVIRLGQGGVSVLPQPDQPRIHLDQLQSRLESDIEQELQAEAIELREAGFQVYILVRFGDPAIEILRYLNEKPIALIAMTTHARSGLRRLFFGSVAKEVLHHVDIPVLMLHPSERPD